MGGTGIAIDRRGAANALRWWLEMGVDCAVQDEPRNWFDAGPAPPAAVLDDAPEESQPPDTLEGFRQWLSASPQAPLFTPQSKPVLPRGSEGAEIMLISEPPARDELGSGAPIGGESQVLAQRMLAAIGMSGKSYIANLACFPSAGGRLSPRQIGQCGSAAKRHVALVRPKLLLLLGDIPSRALLGKPLLQARGHVHEIEGVRAVATFHPRQLLKRPSDKALAWKDLLLLTEEEE